MKFKQLTALAASLLAVACVSSPARPPSLFGRDLADKYERLGNRESEAGHSFNASYFLSKSRAAADGDEVIPDQPKSVPLGATEGQRVNDAYIRLTQALAKGAGRLQPNATANAQVAYDCWLSEDDRRHPMRPTGCRGTFEQNIKQVENAVAANQPALSITPVVPVYKIVVRDDTDIMIANARETLDLAAQDYNRFHPAAVFVDAGRGQDAAGDAVAQALAARGVPAGLIQVRAAPGRRTAHRRRVRATPDDGTIVVEFST